YHTQDDLLQALLSPPTRRSSDLPAARTEGHDPDARLRRPDAPRPPPGQDQLLYEVHRRRGHRGRARDDPEPRGHGLSHLSPAGRSEEHTSELQSRENLVCRLLLE